MSNQNFEHQGGEPLDIERLKREAGFIDFSTINALRIASRTFVSYTKEGTLANKGLARCIEKRKKPYALVGYFISLLKVSSASNEANEMTLLEDAPKPNYALFFALREYMCGEWKERHQPGFPPFMAKVQIVKPLFSELTKAIKDAKEYGLYPWLLTYWGANPKIFGKYKMFEVGALQREKLITELPEVDKIRQFKKLLEELGIKAKNGVILIAPEKFDQAYKEAFAEEIEAWQFARQNIDKPLIEDEEFSEEENGENLNNLEIDF